MSKKRTMETEFLATDIEEALDIIEAYINNQYKSMYLMDAWVKLREFTETKLN